VSAVGRPVGETEASSHPAKKWVTGLMGSKIFPSSRRNAGREF
jgi:hypothetical protein